MKTLLAPLLCILAFTACKNNAVQNTNDKNERFENFIGKLERLELPYKVNCEKCCKTQKVDDTETFGMYPNGIVGIISKNEDWTAILHSFQADMTVPQISIFNDSGVKLKTLDLMTGYCGRGFDYEGIQWLEINQDLTFSWTDTIINYEIDSISVEIKDTQIVEITNRKYQITNDGKINAF